MRAPEMVKLWQDIEKAVVAGEIPLHLAINCTDDTLAEAWALTPNRGHFSTHESRNRMIRLLVVLLRHEPLAMQLVHWVGESDPALADVIAMMDQEYLEPTINRDSDWMVRLRTMSAMMIPTAEPLREVAWILDPHYRLRYPIGLRSNLNLVAASLTRALDSARLLSGDDVTLWKMVRSFGPPTLEQILAAAEVWAGSTQQW